MHAAILLTALVTASEPTDNLPNLQPLVNREWVATRLTAWGLTPASKRTASLSYSPRYHTASNSTILSLHPEEPATRGEAGKAWILKVKHTTLDPRRTTFEAYKGKYQFFPDTVDDDNLILQLAFFRKYEGTFQRNKSEIVWSLDTQWQPKGIHVDVPLNGGAIPGNQVTMSAVNAFFSEGYVPSTAETSVTRRVVSNLRRRVSQKTVYETEFFEQGQTLHFQAAPAQSLIALTRLDHCPPPSFRFHSVAVAKPLAEPVEAKVASSR